MLCKVVLLCFNGMLKCKGQNKIIPSCATEPTVCTLSMCACVLHENCERNRQECQVKLGLPTPSVSKTGHLRILAETR